jgi:ABC-type transport system involved in cytochrome c biogenesis permease subunit
MNDRIFIWLAVTFYGASGFLTLSRLRRSDSTTATHPVNYSLMVAGFILHTCFLYFRGQAVRHCPLTNSFETTVFITWAAVLFYLLVGPSYRVSFLGAFTAPVVMVISLIALLGLDDTTHTVSQSHSPWVEFHAAIAILSYGAFALAFVAGIMYLIQEHQLKSRKLSSSFLLLPSIEQLDVINYRLVLLGFWMLTAGMIGGVVSYGIVGHWTKPKIAWALTAWGIYAVLLAARLGWSLRGRKIVLASMVSFAFVLVSYWTVSALAVPYRGTP